MSYYLTLPRRTLADALADCADVALRRGDARRLLLLRRVGERTEPWPKPATMRHSGQD